MNRFSETDLKRILGGQLSIPEATEKSWEAACRQIQDQQSPKEDMALKRQSLAKDQKGTGKKGRLPKRMILIAALIGVFACAVAAVSLAVSTDFYEAAFGNKSRTSVKSHEVTDPVKGTTHLAPAKEQTELDQEAAQKWLGDILFEEPVVGYFGDYTLTVLGGVEDLEGENGRLYFTLYKEGGFGDQLKQNYYGREQIIPDISFGMVEQSAERQRLQGRGFFGKACYLDESKTTQDTAYMVLTYGMKAAYEKSPGKTLSIWCPQVGSDDEALGTPDNPVVPCADSEGYLLMDLPSDFTQVEHIRFKDAQNGSGSITLSPIGLSLNQLAFSGVGDGINDIRIEFKDGSVYVVADQETMNLDYSFITKKYRLVTCFNRLVDLDDVAAIYVEGRKCIPE